MTVLRARADLYGEQVFYRTNTPNRFSTVQYRCIFVLLFGQYSLQLDNKRRYGTVICTEENLFAVQVGARTQNCHTLPLS